MPPRLLESTWDAKDRGISRALDRGNIASRETRAIGRNGCFEPGFRRENHWAPARRRPLAKPYPCVELGACVHHANDGKAIRPQAIMGRQKLLLEGVEARTIERINNAQPFLSGYSPDMKWQATNWEYLGTGLALIGIGLAPIFALPPPWWPSGMPAAPSSEIVSLSLFVGFHHRLRVLRLTGKLRAR
jgi:hypothetical protein